eukprot:TRINITY_DN66923_c12_g1_i1.p2 TRINITY_DN66923_c12_g1~~TRINITY_DN66923_c12_g1_i1.p2  ORF type:complete len:136 (-),score=3.81 TRINITY_DN66923_c12_g1_i1:21-428(-)
MKNPVSPWVCAQHPHLSPQMQSEKLTQLHSAFSNVSQQDRQLTYITCTNCTISFHTAILVNGVCSSETCHMIVLTAQTINTTTEISEGSPLQLHNPFYPDAVPAATAAPPRQWHAIGVKTPTHPASPQERALAPN